MLFADDSIFFCRETNDEIDEVIRIIEEYSLASGQRVNYQKSSIYFGKEIQDQRRKKIKKRLRIENEGGEGVPWST